MQKECGLFPFWGYFLGYCILSLALFVFTSGGWSSLLFNLIPLAIFYLLIFLIISYFLFILKLKGEKYVFIFPRKLLFLLTTQILAILFNCGDCGDAPGSYSFFEVLLGINGWKICKEPLLGSNAALILSFLSKAVYIITFVIIIVIIFKGRASFKGNKFLLIAGIALVLPMLINTGVKYYVPKPHLVWSHKDHTKIVDQEEKLKVMEENRRMSEQYDKTLRIYNRRLLFTLFMIVNIVTLLGFLFFNQTVGNGIIIGSSLALINSLIRTSWTLGFRDLFLYIAIFIIILVSGTFIRFSRNNPTIRQ